MDLEILKIASNTDNHRILKNPTHQSMLKNPICGDVMKISLKIVKENIVDFGYQCKSCIYCQASTSLLSRNTINKKILNIKNLLKIPLYMMRRYVATLAQDTSARLQGGYAKGQHAILLHP